jgi:hypothetical protein
MADLTEVVVEVVVQLELVQMTELVALQVLHIPHGQLQLHLV